jgi:N-acetylneuraminic acid mutarotase
MIVWGGSGSGGFLNDGGRYNPAGNSWTAMSTTGAPAARALHTAVWTGTVMIVWGGAGSSYLNDTWSYTPGKVMYLYQRP